MKPLSIALQSACFLALCLPAKAQQLQKPAMMSNLDGFAPGLDQVLRPANYTVEAWPAGVISAGCKQRAEADKLDATLIQTYSVSYGDCDIPWILCRHSGSNTSLDQFFSDFGSVPVRMRQWATDVMLKPDPSGANAYAIGTQVVFAGNIQGVGIYLHEVTHTMDFSSAFAVEGSLSDSQTWLDAYDADSAVPDEYARSNQAENVAQFGGIAIYDQQIPGGAGSVPGFDRSKVASQLDAMIDQTARGDAGGRLLDPRGRCTARFLNSGPVAVRSSSSYPSPRGYRRRRDGVNGTAADVLDREGVQRQRERAAGFGIELLDRPGGMAVEEATVCRFG